MKTDKVFSESELFLGCLHKNPAIQELVFKIYSTKMYSLCLKYVKETAAAEDILIEGFMKVFGRIHQFRSRGSFGGWIRKIMINECLMYLDKEKHLSLEIGLDNLLPPYSQIPPTDELYMEDLMKLINNLPPGYRTVFILYVIEGFSHHEIATKLHISENTSKSQLSHARSQLQKMIKSKGVSPSLKLSE